MNINTTFVINRPACTDDYGNVVVTQDTYHCGPATGPDNVFGPGYWGDNSTVEDATETAVELLNERHPNRGWTHLYDYATGRTIRLDYDVCRHGSHPMTCGDCHHERMIDGVEAAEDAAWHAASEARLLRQS